MLNSTISVIAVSLWSTAVDAHDLIAEQESLFPKRRQSLTEPIFRNRPGYRRKSLDKKRGDGSDAEPLCLDAPLLHLIGKNARVECRFQLIHIKPASLCRSQNHLPVAEILSIPEVTLEQFIMHHMIRALAPRKFRRLKGKPGVAEHIQFTELQSVRLTALTACGNDLVHVKA